MTAAEPARVVIVGGGMGGVQAARTLAGAPVEITLADVHNYYLFQPLAGARGRRRARASTT